MIYMFIDIAASPNKRGFLFCSGSPNGSMTIGLKPIKCRFESDSEHEGE